MNQHLKSSRRKMCFTGAFSEEPLQSKRSIQYTCFLWNSINTNIVPLKSLLDLMTCFVLHVDNLFHAPCFCSGSAYRNMFFLGCWPHGFLAQKGVEQQRFRDLLWRPLWRMGLWCQETWQHFWLLANWQPWGLELTIPFVIYIYRVYFTKKCITRYMYQC